MKRKTRDDLSADLVLKTHECAMLSQLNISQGNKIADLELQIRWHKQMSQELIACLRDGAKEAIWPRRANS